MGAGRSEGGVAGNRKCEISWKSKIVKKGKKRPNKYDDTCDDVDDDVDATAIDQDDEYYGENITFPMIMIDDNDDNDNYDNDDDFDENYDNYDNEDNYDTAIVSPFPCWV